MKQPVQQLNRHQPSDKKEAFFFIRFVFFVLMVCLTASGCALCQKKNADPFNSSAPAPAQTPEAITAGTTACPTSTCPASTAPISSSPVTGGTVTGTGSTVPAVTPAASASPAPVTSSSSPAATGSVPVIISSNNDTPGGSVTGNTSVSSNTIVNNTNNTPADSSAVSANEEPNPAIKPVANQKSEDSKDDLLNDPQSSEKESGPAQIEDGEWQKGITDYSKNDNNSPYRNVSQDKDKAAAAGNSSNSSNNTPNSKPSGETKSEEIPAQSPNSGGDSAQYGIPAGTSRVSFRTVVHP